MMEKLENQYGADANGSAKSITCQDSGVEGGSLTTGLACPTIPLV
jgi:hypothetical protein